MVCCRASLLAFASVTVSLPLQVLQWKQMFGHQWVFSMCDIGREAWCARNWLAVRGWWWRQHMMSLSRTAEASQPHPGGSPAAGPKIKGVSQGLLSLDCARRLPSSLCMRTDIQNDTPVGWNLPLPYADRWKYMHLYYRYQEAFVNEERQVKVAKFDGREYVHGVNSQNEGTSSI